MSTETIKNQSPKYIVDLPYQSVPGNYDELLSPNGTFRPHWQNYLNGISNRTSADFDEHSIKLNKLVRETGIAHNLFADPSEENQPWIVDPIPLIIDSAEWAWLEEALNQRARLYNAILCDLYGPQKLLRKDAIPPDLIFSDPTFLRPCHGMITDGNFLQFYAADLARGPDGQWFVLDNHAETPAGSGFALANRIITTNCDGNLFRSCNVIRLSSFYEKLQGELTGHTGRDNPSIALLTPGPLHDDYFGHAYLARYLGYILVEGEDLIVGDGQVYLKTLEGLLPIDLIVRCVESNSCDPLELNPNGFLGPVGLVSACRKKSRLIVNSLGSSLIENRALGAILPKLCETILGESLLLHDKPRHWLGRRTFSNEVMSNLADFVIRGVHESTGRPGLAETGIVGADMSLEEQNLLKQKIDLHGKNMVAEKFFKFATTPSWNGRQLAPERYALRLFSARVQDDYSVMPGGLAMTIQSDSATGLNAPQGKARDIWILSETQVSYHLSRLRPSLESIQFSRTGLALPSRVADNLFWLGRYAERSEWTMRLIRSILDRIEVDSGPEEDTQTMISALTVWLTKDPGAPLIIGKNHDLGQVMAGVRALIHGPQRNYGLQASLENLHRVAGITRDRLSQEAWTTLNSFVSDGTWCKNLDSLTTNDIVRRLNEGIIALTAFSGMVMENMTRNFGWRFLDIGRRIERAINLSELVLALFADRTNDELERDRLSYLLELADSSMTYRARYRLAPVLPAVLDLLLLDETNPRALAFQLTALAEHIEALSAGIYDAPSAKDKRIVLDLLERIQQADPNVFLEFGENVSRDTLQKLLEPQVQYIQKLSNEITKKYFRHNIERPHRVITR